ncbi:MAG: GIY-YIG nuclease family protein [Methylococcaceae bacterium]
MYIYKIDIPATGQCYIGQTTKSYEFRFSQHKNPKAISLIGRAIQHWRDPKIIVLHKVNSKDELNRLETEEIRARNTIFPFGYNLSAGGAEECAKHKDDPEDYEYTPDDSDINLLATIKESKRGFTTLIKHLMPERYIDDEEYNEIADDFGVKPETRRSLHGEVRIANNIWTGKVEKIGNSGTWWANWNTKLQQGHVSHEEMVEMLENPGDSKKNINKNESYIKQMRKICNSIHARIAETTSLRLPQ